MKENKKRNQKENKKENQSIWEFKELEKVSRKRKVYNEEKFIKLIEEAVRNLSKDKVAVADWSVLQKELGITCKTHSFIAKKTKEIFDGVLKTLRNIENKYNILITDDRSNQKILIKKM